MNIKMILRGIEIEIPCIYVYRPQKSIELFLMLTFFMHIKYIEIQFYIMLYIYIYAYMQNIDKDAFKIRQDRY